MAFPVVTGVVNSRQNTMSTSHPVTLPDPLTPGAPLLVVAFCHNNLSPSGYPDGFTRQYRAPVVPGSGNVNVEIWGYNRVLPALLPILGVERGERTVVPGSTFTLTTTFNRKTDIYALAFGDVDVPLSFFAYAQATGGATPVNPPNLVYSGSAKDVLWWALGVGIGFDPAATYPANFTLHQDNFFFTGTGTPSSWGCGICARELNAASEDPGTWPADSGPTSDWYGVTVGLAVEGP